eukprot:CAMPEP_0172454406 /NCGR_PEP_ID=MMETSP1065-20121228/11402_1 /TAXON_ID=265537 /ORGANISM="Amphiprora paludosa, Strain CCMP125" /LENGTH=118 /DNA_ID=CAMNT_0013206729 /DNA_START=356 /DNA_END=710 /DNA_ORIENTATION=-
MAHPSASQRPDRMQKKKKKKKEAQQQQQCQVFSGVMANRFLRRRTAEKPAVKWCGRWKDRRGPPRLFGTSFLIATHSVTSQEDHPMTGLLPFVGDSQRDATLDPQRGWVRFHQHFDAW